LDWGGTGEALVLIHGGGVSPHHFDDLAPRLTDRFRVIAPARRGHGKSEIQSEEFDVDALAEDLRQVLDSLGIERASLLGHSFAGAEITRFAALYPERVHKLIYLDAHYEQFESPWLDANDTWPEEPCWSGDFHFFPEFRDCFLRYSRPGLSWSPTMEAVLQDMMIADSNGFLSPKIGAPQTMASLNAINLGYRREYERLAMPVLVIFAERFSPPATTDTAWDRRTSEWHTRYYLPAREWTERRFREAIPHVRMVTLPGTGHEDLFFRDPDRLLDEIRSFLLELDAGTSAEGNPR
jgi:pimeloyl-ACP methyl ester carboxylesterase